MTRRGMAPLAALILGIGCLAATSPNAQTTSRSGSLEARVSQLESVISGGALVDLLDRLETLELDLRRLQGRIETTEHRLDTVLERQRSLYRELDERMVVLDERIEAMTAGDNGTMSLPRPDLGPAALYQDGQDYFDAGRYRRAAARFAALVARYPEHTRAAQAQYWLGESYVAQERFGPAARAFEGVLADYPDHAKVPAARLKLGLSLIEQGDKAAGRAALRELLETAPQSTAARQARERLSRLGDAGSSAAESER